MPVVYIDVLFLINFIMDSILLVITGRLSGRNFSVFKILAGGALGGFYSASIFFAPLSFLSAWLIKLMVSAVMVGIPFGFKPIKKLIRYVLNFYLASFLLGGALSAIFYFSGRPSVMANGIYYFPLSVFQLILVSFPLTISLTFYYKKSKNRLINYGKYCIVTIGVKDKKITVPGIIDTGCFLTDPYCEKPVIIIDPDIAGALLDQRNFAFRLIPYSTIESGGLMKAFSPDLCTLQTADKTFECSCSIAISPAHSGGRAIINPDILNNFGGLQNEL